MVQKVLRKLDKMIIARSVTAGEGTAIVEPHHSNRERTSEWLKSYLDRLERHVMGLSE